MTRRFAATFQVVVRAAVVEMDAEGEEKAHFEQPRRADWLARRIEPLNMVATVMRGILVDKYWRI
jgi:hypothetical protein